MPPRSRALTYRLDSDRIYDQTLTAQLSAGPAREGGGSSRIRAAVKLQGLRGNRAVDPPAIGRRRREEGRCSSG
jgi:hypothetical protein